MSRYLGFVRHGAYHQLPDTPSAFQPFALSPEGIKHAQQGAQELVEHCHNLGIQSISLHCSVLQRAWQTARIIEDNLLGAGLTVNGPLTQTPLLNERSVGAVANLPIDTIEIIVAEDDRYPNLPEGWKSDSHFCLPFAGAESLMQAGERVSDYVKKILNNHTDTDLILFIGHGASIRHGAHLLDLLRFGDIRQLSMYYGHPVVFKFNRTTDLPEPEPVAGRWKQRQQHTSYCD